MNPEKAVNHGEHSEHGEKTRTCLNLTNHLPGETKKTRKVLVFRRARRPAGLASRHVRCGLN